MLFYLDQTVSMGANSIAGSGVVSAGIHVSKCAARAHAHAGVHARACASARIHARTRARGVALDRQPRPRRPQLRPPLWATHLADSIATVSPPPPLSLLRPLAAGAAQDEGQDEGRQEEQRRHRQGVSGLFAARAAGAVDEAAARVTRQRRRDGAPGRGGERAPRRRKDGDPSGMRRERGGGRRGAALQVQSAHAHTTSRPARPPAHCVNLPRRRHRRAQARAPRPQPPRPAREA